MIPADWLPWTDALLTWLHLSAVLGWAVFMTSCTALLRPDWLNGSALQRLQLTQRLATGAGAATLLTGVLKALLGAKGAAWLLGQPLLGFKLLAALAMVVVCWRAGTPLRRWLARWRSEARQPPAGEVDRLRQRLLRAAHGMLWVTAAGVLLSRGLLAL
ncbi:MAG: hypothetical protein RIQ53_3411 [Pseudomonadota bacterium]|jgi:putative membrane protein